MGIKGYILSSVLFMLILPLKNNAQDIPSLIKEAQRLESSFQQKEALQKYLEVLRYQPSNLAALCKASELYNVLGKHQPEKDDQKKYYRTAKEYAQKALAQNANSSEANFVMSLAMGRMAQITSGDERVKAVKEVKTYAEKCVQLDPNNYKGYHVLGKWHYEISDLSSFERWMIKVTYEALPKGTLEDAIRNYEKSKQLNPGFVLNYLELAKAWHRKDDDKKAIELLEAMMKLPNTTAEDAGIKEEGRKLLDDWK